jgi:hypothetical protein
LPCSWIIAIFKECLIKSRNSHCLYAHKLYFNAWKLFQKWKRLQNVRHIQNVFKFWGICSTFLSEITLYIYICREYLAYSINHHVVLFIFKILLFKTKDLNSIKMMWNHTKPETLPPIIRCVRCRCENIILYRYQVTLIVLDQFLFSNNILMDN